jgi:hypothetical protein
MNVNVPILVILTNFCEKIGDLLGKPTSNVIKEERKK